MTSNLPPEHAIEAARISGTLSPCSKSKRGVVLFDPRSDGRPVISRGYNGPPDGFGCAGTATCKSSCAKVCMHAEQRAILEGITVQALDLLHVKVVEGVTVAGKAPCCLECSRLVVQVKLAGVWLFQSTDVAGEGSAEDPPCSCRARHIANADIANQVERGFWRHDDRWIPGDLIEHRFDCSAMLAMSEWRYYSAVEFHRATLINHGLDVLAGPERA
jgi:deoxycytidylate deaminase